MLTLPRPTSWYFETCRQIIWCRLSYDKLYILYSDDARHELETIWCAAISRAGAGTMFTSAADILDTAIQTDDREWRAFVETLEGNVALADAIDDYFLGDSAEQVVTEIEGGGYRAV
jgi:hypothetical protein